MTRALVRIVLALLLALAALPVWLGATESGLRAALALAQRVAGERLTVTFAGGTLLGGFTVTGLQFAGPGVDVRAGRVAAELDFAPLAVGELRFAALDVESLHVTVEAAPPPSPRVPLNVSAPFALAVGEGRLRDLRIAAGATQWQLPAAELSASWRGEAITVSRLRAETLEAGPVALTGRLAIVDDRLQLENVELQEPVALSAQGRAALFAGADTDLTLRWRALRLPAQFGTVPASVGAGQLHVTGPFGAERADLRTAAEVQGLPLELSAQLVRGDRELGVSRLEVAALGGRLQGEGAVRWADGLAAQLQARFEHLDPGTRFPDWPGDLNGTLALDGRRKGDTLALDFDATLNDSQLRGMRAQLRAVGRTDGGRVVLRSLRAQQGATTLQAQGEVWPRFAVTASGRSADLATLAPGLEGQAEAKATLRGTPQAPELELAAEGRNLRVANRSLRQARLEAHLAFAGRSYAKLELRDLLLEGKPAQATLTAQGTRERHSAELLLQQASGRSRVAVAGGLRARDWRGELRALEVALSWRPNWQLEEPAALAWIGGTFRNEPACLRSGESRVCAQLTASAARQRLAFRVHAFELEHLALLLPPSWALHSTVTGTAVGELRAGELAELRADLAASAGSLESGGTRVSFGPGTLQVAPDGSELAARLRLQPAGGEVSADVRLAATTELARRPMRGRVLVRLPDLAWMTVLSPEIAAARGALTADLAVGGTPQQPSLDGDLKIENGAVTLATPGIELTHIGGLVRSGPAAPLSLALDARSGGGAVHLQGQLQTLTPRATGSFRLWGEDVEFLNTADAHVWVTPDLTLELAEGAQLRGTIKVPRADITPRDLHGRGVGPSRDQVLVSDAAPAEPAGLPLASEVTIELGEQVRFDGLGLKTRLTGRIDAADKPGLPTHARGELRLDGGRYKAYGQDLQIESGRLVFDGPVTEPWIDLRAYREPREDIKVGLNARGAIAAPQFSLYSTPAMSQEEQLSWLVLGRSLQQTLASGQAATLADPALSLGLSGGDWAAQRLAPRLGLDEVSVGARPGETADQARFTIGKYLSPKLFISYGVGLFQPGNFFRLQYDLGRGFKLAGESGVHQGGDVLYTIERGAKKKP